MAQSGTVTIGNDILASEYNNLRIDVLSNSQGHRHDGTANGGRLIQLTGANIGVAGILAAAQGGTGNANADADTVDGYHLNQGVSTGSSPTFSALTTSGTVIIATTQKLYLDGGSDTYIYEGTANVMSFYTGGTEALNLGALGAQVALFSADVALAATKKLYLDGGAHTYITEGSSDRIDIYVGGTLGIQLSATMFAPQSDMNLAATKKLYLDGGGNTYIYENVGDQFALVVGGTNYMQITSGTFAINSADLVMDLTKKIYLDNGGDTYIYESSGNNIRLTAGGTSALEVNNAYIGANIDVQLVQTKRLYLDTDTDTWITGAADDQIDFYTGNNNRMAIFNTKITMGVDLQIAATKKLYLDGGGDTYLTEVISVNRIDMYCGGSRAASATTAGFEVVGDLYCSGDLSAGMFNGYSKLHVREASSGVGSVKVDTVVTIENNAAAYISFITPNNVAAGLRFGDPQSNFVGNIIFDHVNNVMTFQSGSGSDVVYLDATVSMYPATNGGPDFGKVANRWDTIYCVTLNESSDVRTKRAIEDFNDFDINKLPSSKLFLHEKDLDDQQKHLGFLAQDMPKEIVQTGEDGMLSYEVGGMLSYLIGCIKLQQNKINTLEKRLS